MNITVTARHFKAPTELQQFAESSIQGLEQFYDGIVRAEVVLDDLGTSSDDKMAEVALYVYREKLFAKEKTDEFVKSISACIEKLERQLTRYKEKLHEGQRPHQRPEIARGERI